MKWLLTIFSITILLCSCEEELPPIRTDSYGNMSMKVDGREIVMRVPHPARHGGNTIDPKAYIQFQAVNCEELMELAICFDPETGEHDIVLGQFKTNRKGGFCFRPGSGYTTGNWHTIVGRSNISEIGDRIRGTFEFTAHENQGNNVYVISDGSFNVEMAYD